MRKCAIRLFGGLVALSSAAGAHAAVVGAEFNDIGTGGINGKGGGIGWTGNWSGSAGGQVVANDLTSALYNVPQGGTPQHYRSVNATGLRQNYRTPAVSPTGTVWFSFLAMAEAAGDRAGLSFNPPTATPFNDPGTAYAYLVGDALNYSFGSGTAGTVTGVAPVGSTVLVVGKVEINGGAGGADPVSLWVNPDLIANPDITAYTPVYSGASVDWLNTMGIVGAVAARADGATSGGGNVDNIRISDGGGNAAQAFADVTNTPEPGTAAVLGAAVVAGLAGRRRRAR